MCLMQVSKLPKCASMIVPRFIKPLCQVYCDLQQCYQSGPDALSLYIQQHSVTFIRDGNYGLVKQLLVSQYKQSIQKLTRTFLTLSLSDVALRVKLQLPELAQQYLLNMIEDGEIYASINQRDGMVVFKDNPEQYNATDTLDLLHQRLLRVMELEQRLEEMEESIQLNPTYIHKLAGSSEEDLPAQQMATTSTNLQP
uniref:COP9 signalosome complex subunit 3 n=1 Tax=Hirondellea gigas TaxID=1518452 RepID=A0A6A7FXA2_9CRUS